VIRPAVRADVDAIAEAHVKAWETTYPGIFPESVIESFTHERRQAQWREWFAGPPARSALLVAECAGVVVGFAHTGPFRGGVEPSPDGELYAIYLRQEAQRSGLGRRLFEAALDALRAARFDAMRCWVIEGNPAAAFYEKLGGVRVASQTFEAGGTTMTEHAYRFELQPR
jgi:GNAT superfamily N-acetyltransferase